MSKYLSNKTTVASLNLMNTIRLLPLKQVVKLDNMYRNYYYHIWTTPDLNVGIPHNMEAYFGKEYTLSEIELTGSNFIKIDNYRFRPSWFVQERREAI